MRLYFSVLLFLVSTIQASNVDNGEFHHGYGLILDQNPNPQKEQQLNMRMDLVTSTIATFVAAGRTPVEPVMKFLVKNFTWWEVVGRDIMQEHSWNDGYYGEVIHKLGEFFDINGMASELETGLLTHEEWKKEVEIIRNVPTNNSNGIVNQNGEEFVIDLVISGVHDGYECANGSNVHLVSAGILKFLAKEYLCVPLNITNAQLLELLSNKTQKHVALQYFDHYVYQGYSAARHDLLRFSEQINLAADSYIEAELPNGYLAMHWRRGDRNFRWDGNGISGALETALSDPIQATEFVKRVMERTGLPILYLATNSGVQSEIDYLSSRVRTKRLVTSLWDQSIKIAVMDMAICAKADHFIMAPAVRGLYSAVSTFSRRIMLQRIHFGGFEHVVTSHYSVCCGDLPAVLAIAPLQGVYSVGEDIEIVAATLNVPLETSLFVSVRQYTIPLSPMNLQYPIRSGRVLREDEPNNYADLYEGKMIVPAGMEGRLELYFDCRYENNTKVEFAETTIVLDIVNPNQQG